MRISYGWLDSADNHAFVDRSFEISSTNPCLLIGRNGTGKTLAAKITALVRSITFDNNDLREKSLSELRNIGIDWFRVEISIPMVSFQHDGYDLSTPNEFAYDLIYDETTDEEWCASFEDDESSVIPGYNFEQHSFSSKINVHYGISNLQSSPELEIGSLLISQGTLELDKNDEDSWDSHLGFSSEASGNIVRIEDLSFPPATFNSNLWFYISIQLYTFNMSEMRGQYQNQVIQIIKDLSKKCITYGDPGLWEYDGTILIEQRKNSSLFIEIMRKNGTKQFPKLIIKEVVREVPQLDDWKKSQLNDLARLHNTIVDLYGFPLDDFGIGCEMLIDRYEEMEELYPSKTRFSEKTELDMVDEIIQSLSNHNAHEKWLEILPLYVPRFKDNSFAFSDFIDDLDLNVEMNNSQKENYLTHYHEYIKKLFQLVSNCFPRYIEFVECEDKYNILQQSMEKFCSEGFVGRMYVAAIKDKLTGDFLLPDYIEAKKIYSDLYDSSLVHLEDLSKLIPNFMLSFWYGFEEDRDVICLYETYNRFFASEDKESKEYHDSRYLPQLSEFLMLISNRDFIPSGYRNLLSMILEISAGEEECILFIDEPEISLHIDWQRKFVKHFSFLLSETRNNSMLMIATHSPDVILNHIENVVNFSYNVID